ncbi:MAG: 50S ribosomal protein L19e [Dehalococcoidia bacterium]|jgi:large subunit ribosomal protein L19e|nr:50S ribosomal protein L19e [Dehalococcoidia bacterium]|tara:strand:+ start:164 stop:628 length:465 start_codon:yes stop_codon:yes gene_type:complete
MNLSYQKRVASGILKCGVHRVWVDDRPEVQERISEAVTREDVRLLVVQRFIRKHQKKGISRGRAKAMANQRSKGRRRGHGSRKGHGGARTPKKGAWMTRVRALRKELSSLRAGGEIDAAQYRRYYRRVKGGVYNSRNHLRYNMEIDGVKLGGGK